MLSPTTKTSFNSASEAYDYWYWKLFRDGENFGNTKALFNVGFYITNPKNMLKLNGNGIYLVILTYQSLARYTVKFQLYGEQWLINTAM